MNQKHVINPFNHHMQSQTKGQQKQHPMKAQLNV